MVTKTRSPRGSTEETFAERVAHLDDRRSRAMEAGDVASLARMFHDRLVYQHSSGALDSKASLLSKIESGSLRYHRVAFHHLRVEATSGIAIVTAEMHAEVSVDGEPRALRTTCSTVWRDADDGMRVVAVFNSQPIS